MGQPLPDLPKAPRGHGWRFAHEYIAQNGPTTIQAMLPNGTRIDFIKMQKVLSHNPDVFKIVGHVPGPSGKTRSLWGLRHGQTRNG